jgi:cell division cycle 14
VQHANAVNRYERYERVDQGDFNWVSPDFVAFASPQSKPVTPIPVSSPAYATLPSCVPEIEHARISEPFKNVLTHFVQRDVGLVVRLNSELYCPTYFTALGIQHIDMIFEDGTCPALPIVRKFIKLAHDMIAKNKAIAVHCKAGLGRTGCLIGAYLIYRHGFTANEVIAFMRFMRPGMVVGPQQHWLHLNQGQFREWYLEDQWKAKMELEKPSTPRGISAKTPVRFASGAQTATPDRSSAQRTALGEIDGNDVATAGVYQDENLPAPTPGQPRKYARMDPRHHPYSRSSSGTMRVSGNKSESEVVTMETLRQSTNGGDSEEELILQRAASRRSQSKSPGSKGKARSVSYTTTTTTVTKSFDVGDTMGIYEDDGDVNFKMEDTNAIWDELAQEQENLKLSTRSEKPETTRTKTPRSASGMGAMSVSKTRSLRESPRRSGGEDKMKVRKTSGRVGSSSHGPVGVKR